MCNDYEQHVRWAEYYKMMQALELTIPSRQSELDLPQADDIRINDTGPVMRSTGDEIELVPMTFSFPPGRPGAAVLLEKEKAPSFDTEVAHKRPEQKVLMACLRAPRRCPRTLGIRS